MLNIISERNALKKDNISKFNDDVKHIGTRYTSLGQYYCQLTILSEDKPTAQNKPDFNNLSNHFEQMSDEQIYDLARTLKFNVHYVKHDSDFSSNSDEEEVHLTLLTNNDFKNWATIHPGLKYNRAHIVSHNRSKLTGYPFPERIFNKIVVTVNLPSHTAPIDIN